MRREERQDGTEGKRTEMDIKGRMGRKKEGRGRGGLKGGRQGRKGLRKGRGRNGKEEGTNENKTGWMFNKGREPGIRKGLKGKESD